MAVTGHALFDVLTGFVLFYVAEFLAFRGVRMPLPWGLLWISGILALFLWMHLSSLRRPHHRPRLAAAIRPRWPRAPRPLLIRGLASFVLFRVGVFLLFMEFVHSSPQTTEAVRDLFFAPRGRAEQFLHFYVAVVVGPLIEEFAFRGWIQSALQRRFGRATAVLGAAALFSLAHGVPAVGAFVMGTIFGAAVLLTRSIWAGVLLHGLTNALAEMVALFGLDSLLPAIGSPFLLILWAACTLCGTAGLVCFARDMQRSSRGARPV